MWNWLTFNGLLPLHILKSIKTFAKIIDGGLIVLHFVDKSLINHKLILDSGTFRISYTVRSRYRWQPVYMHDSKLYNSVTLYW